MIENSTVSSIGESDFKTYVLESEVPVVVDFWAPWCSPCRMVSPIVEELSQEYGEKVRFAKLNIDDNEDITVQFGIQSIPALVIFSEGREVNRLVGFAPKEQLKRQIDRSLMA